MEPLWKKCEFFRSEINDLGRTLSVNGVKPQTEKLQAIREWPVPRLTKDIQSFLGLVGYYRKFIYNFAQIAEPMTSHIKKNTKL